MKHFCLLALILSFVSTSVFAEPHGIYLTQSTVENTPEFRRLIQEAKATGIDTFVIDVNTTNETYARNVKLLKDYNIRYVARLVVFADGGTQDLIRNPAYWKSRWKKGEYAINLGAEELQLDYIRYKASQPRSPQNALDIEKVLQYFRQKTREKGVKLQTDVFGIATFRPAVEIGQDLTIFANHVDAICPMVYPSHYEPHPYPSQHPYDTVYKSIAALKKQIKNFPDTKIYAFIEAYNYRYPMSNAQKTRYIAAEIKAAQDAGADGWYFWSAHNSYDILFSVLKGNEFKQKVSDLYTKVMPWVSLIITVV